MMVRGLVNVGVKIGMTPPIVYYYINITVGVVLNSASRARISDVKSWCPIINYRIRIRDSNGRS